MRILLLTDSYPPEVRSASHLMYEFANGLTERKHKVTVVTASPGYNLAEGTEVRRTRFASISEESGVRVIRIWSLPFHNVSRITRGIGQLGLTISMFIGGLISGKVDVIFIYSPPLTMGLAGVLLGRTKRVPYVLNVQDLFPQNAIDLGVLRGRLLIRLFESMESLVYKCANLITVHSVGNSQHILSKTHDSRKIKVIPNWVDLTEYQPGARGQIFRSKHNILEETVVVLFAGVMGYAQDLTAVIEAAWILRTEKQIIFLLVGDGVEKPRLQSQVKEWGLQNVQFLPFVSKEAYPELVAASDIGLITLKKTMRTPVVPSKVLGYMAAGKPCVLSVNPESDAISIVKNAECGIVVHAGDPSALAEAIRFLSQGKGDACEMGPRGRVYAEKHFSKCVALDRYEKLLQDLLVPPI